MAENILERLFEHNHWANLRIIEACSALSDQQLDAEPRSATAGSIRRTLLHIVDAQQAYLADLTGVEPRLDWSTPPTFAELRRAAGSSGEGLIALARDASSERLAAQIHADDGYVIAPWVLVVQIINHATEHREQIKSMLSALGVEPPRVDGWSYGRVEDALIVPST